MALLKSDLKICFKHIKVRDYNLKHKVMCYEFKKLNKENGYIYMAYVFLMKRVLMGFPSISLILMSI